MPGTSSHTLFPEKFTWGAAAASYQIEGAARQDGRGLSVWDAFCEKPGAIIGGHTGEVSCDHYNRYESDVALMSQIGLQAYRLSVSWTRIFPNGRGRPSAAGLSFYDRLVDSLLAAEIQPWVTLFHWDFPYELYLQGGWLNRESATWFADYVGEVVDLLSDRVSHWITLNEPQCFIGLGHLEGVHAPGLKLSRAEALLAGHHALLAHGRAVQVIRERAKSKPIIAWAPVGVVAVPASDDVADIEAARRMTLDEGWNGLWSNTWWADPPLLGHYPEAALRILGKDAPKVRPGDMELIKQPIDLYGCNTYSGEICAANAEGLPVKVEAKRGWPETHYHWKVLPETLYWGPKFLHERYKLPIVITENGLSSADWVAVDGGVHDPGRIDYITRYLRELHRAIQDGVPVEGYFVWSLMDNFEWNEGYRHRFGLIHVDYETQKRTLKDSATWYSEVISTRGRILSGVREMEGKAPRAVGV